LKSGLVAYYQFDGTAEDKSGNNNHGLIQGGVSVVTDRTKKNGKALRFDGLSGCIEIANGMAFDFSSNLTIAFWVNPGKQPTSNSADIFSKGQWADSNLAGTQWSVENSGLINSFHFFFQQASTPPAFIQSTYVTYPQGDWSHLVISKSRLKVTTYFDGVNVGSETMSNPNLLLNGGLSLTIGAIKGSNGLFSRFFNGSLDDIFIFNRAITAMEVTELYSFDLPTGLPSRMPTGQPSRQPSACPTSQPTSKPTSSRPSTKPSHYPSEKPSNQPIASPSCQPSSSPSNPPTVQPSVVPSTQPVAIPSSQPSSPPTNQPTAFPTCQPSMNPSVIPSSGPSRQPSTVPSSRPSNQPSGLPSVLPTLIPSVQPSGNPTGIPSSLPSSSLPSTKPSRIPTSQPSSLPSSPPSSVPTTHPSTDPSVSPRTSPSSLPSIYPSSHPSKQPSSQPSGQPTCLPSDQPTTNPSNQPTERPSTQPTTHPSDRPSRIPTKQPLSMPSGQPTSSPSNQPTIVPSNRPTRSPSSAPSNKPSRRSSLAPSAQSTVIPSHHPSCQPSNQPTVKPSKQPVSHPSSQPTSVPRHPSISPSRATTQPTTSKPIIKIPTVLPPFPLVVPTAVPTIQTISVLPSSAVPFKGSLFFFGSFLTQTTESIPNIDLLEEDNVIGSSYIVFGFKDKERKVQEREIIIGSRSSHGLYTPIIRNEEQTAGLIQDRSMSRASLPIGDVNGDSFEDLIVCDPINNYCNVYLNNRIVGFQNLRVSFVIKSDHNDLFGWSIAKLNDINGDNFDDFAISALSSNNISIFFGSNNVPDEILIDQRNLAIIGSQFDQNSGLALSSAGDFNSDGTSDLLFSAVQLSPFQNVIYVLFLRPQMLKHDIAIDNLIPNRDYFKISAPLFSFAGFSLSNLGDINQDGFDDIIIGSIPYSARYLTQKSYVIYGRNSSSMKSLDLSQWKEEDGFAITGGGFMVGGSGDVNGDGIPDIMISSYQQWQGKGNNYIMVYPNRNISSPPTFLPSSQPSSMPSVSPSSLPSILVPFPTNLPTSKGGGVTFPPFLPTTFKPTFAPKILNPTRMNPFHQTIYVFTHR
jgi:hypothetical protein